MNNTSKADWARIDAMADVDIDRSDILLMVITIKLENLKNLIDQGFQLLGCLVLMRNNYT